jgi:hypothetical protein
LQELGHRDITSSNQFIPFQVARGGYVANLKEFTEDQGVDERIYILQLGHEFTLPLYLVSGKWFLVAHFLKVEVGFMGVAVSGEIDFP